MFAIVHVEGFPKQLIFPCRLKRQISWITDPSLLPVGWSPELCIHVDVVTIKDSTQPGGVATVGL